MGRPYLAVDNNYSVRQHPTHVIASKSDPNNVIDAYRVADGRRSIYDFATHDSPNDEWWIRWTAPELRGVTYVALDRGHNLAGKRIIYELSNDGFVSSVETVFDIAALPSSPGAGSLDNALGVVMDDGAWIKRVPFRAARAGQLRIPAMGAGIRPIVVGLWAGIGWAPPEVDLPTSDNQARFNAEAHVSEAGWMGLGSGTRQRVGLIGFRLTDVFSYEDARFHVEEQWGRRRPMWVVRDDEEAHRTVLAQIDAERAGFDFRTPGWFYPSASIPWIEHEPKR